MRSKQSPNESLKAQPCLGCVNAVNVLTRGDLLSSGPICGQHMKEETACFFEFIFKNARESFSFLVVTNGNG